MATHRPVVLPIIFCVVRTLLHFVIFIAWIVFVMVKTFKAVDDPGSRGVRMYYYLLFETLVLACIAVYSVWWTGRAIRRITRGPYEW